MQSSDRGDMQAIYTQYRTLKKNIRDDAATSIQRCALLFLARCRRVAGTVGAAGLAGLARCDGGTDEGSSSAGNAFDVFFFVNILISPHLVTHPLS